MGKDEFLNLTPFEFNEVYEAWLSLRNKQNEIDLFHARYAAREALFAQLTAKFAKGQKITPLNLYILPGEEKFIKEIGTKKASDSEMKAAHEMYSNANKK